jgi:UDP-glucose 4-epimerase
VRRACVTGGAGFIGSTLADRLAAQGVEVVVVDNFRTGRHEFVTDLLRRPQARLVEGDVLDQALLEEAFTDCDWVFHLQANADVRRGFERPQLDLEQNALATSTVLEAMRSVGVSRIAFSSTGSVYGEPAIFPTPETAPFPVQTSLYAASKVAAEGLISAYSHALGFVGLIFRFVSILGERYTHGHVFDFYRALRADPARLRVLGDGRQEKSYLYVQDCIDGMLTAVAQHEGDAGTAVIYNLGTDETLLVDDSVRVITKHLGVDPEIVHTGGRRGWPGDSPFILLDCAKIRSLGWQPQVSIADAVVRTLDWFDTNPYLIAETAGAR